MNNRTVDNVTDMFKDILSDELKTANYFENIYKDYIVDWISFSLYNFTCIKCNHINKSILVDRIFEYAVNLHHCRVCNHPRSPNDVNVVDLENVVKSKQNMGNQDIDLRAMTSHDLSKISSFRDDGTYYEKYECGIPIRYTVLKPKYGSIAEEILLNDIIRLKIRAFKKYLKEAQSIHFHAQKLKQTEANISATECSRDFGIYQNECIGVSHLLVILIYTENIQFARTFSQCYWDWKDFNLFCDNFYWFGRSLYEAVYFYGKRFDHNRFKITPLKHTFPTTMEFESFAPTINFPAATNGKLDEADETGFILSYTPKYIHEIDNTRCVSTSQWSGYNNHEWLFMGSSKIQICSIKLQGEEFTDYNFAMLYLEKILTQNIYDRDYYNTINNTLYLP
eukprot:469344_1